jgi:hypothetical protein
MNCISHVQSAKTNFEDERSTIFKMDRPYRFTYLCLNRPYMDILYTENGASEFFGKVVK